MNYLSKNALVGALAIVLGVCSWAHGTELFSLTGPTGDGRVGGGGTNGNLGNDGYTLGASFTVNTPGLSVTALGGLDLNNSNGATTGNIAQDGFLGTVKINLWDNASNSTPVASVTIASGAAPAGSFYDSNDYLFENLTTPLALTTGHTYTLGFYSSNISEPLKDFTGTTTTNTGADTTDFTFPTNSARFDTAVGGPHFPSGSAAGTSYLGPNLITVPEPTSLTLIPAAVIGAMIPRRRPASQFHTQLR